MNADRGSDPSFVEMLISDPDLRLNPTVEWSPHAKDRWGERAGAVGWEFVDLVVSVIELGDRPDDEQRHVRQQVRDE